MSTIREITYLILDELKLSSDDSTFTENHIIYLINNYRALLLKQRYSDIKKNIPSSNYIEICLEMEEFKSPPSRPCEEDFYYIRSTKKIIITGLLMLRTLTGLLIHINQVLISHRRRKKASLMNLMHSKTIQIMTIAFRLMSQNLVMMVYLRRQTKTLYIM